MIHRARLVSLFSALLLASCGADTPPESAAPPGSIAFLDSGGAPGIGVDLVLELDGVSIEVFPNVSYQTNGIWYDLGPGDKQPVELERLSDILLDGHRVHVTGGVLHVGDASFGSVSEGDAVRTTEAGRVEVNGVDRGALPAYRAPE